MDGKKEGQKEGPKACLKVNLTRVWKLQRKLLADNMPMELIVKYTALTKEHISDLK